MDDSVKIVWALAFLRLHYGDYAFTIMFQMEHNKSSFIIT